MIRTPFTTSLVISLAVAGLAANAACSSGSSGTPSTPGGSLAADGGLDGAREASSRSSGGSSGGSSGSAQNDGSTILVDGASASDGASSDAAVTPATDAPMDDPTCSPKTQYGSPTKVLGVPAFSAQPLVTMTNDELTVAWVVDSGGGQGTVYVADRGSATAPFGAASQVPSASTGDQLIDGAVADAGDTYFAFDRVALSADGQRLIAVAAGGRAMAQFTRPDRSSAFATPPFEPPFVTLAQTLMPGELLGDPVLSASGDDLVYSKYGKSPTLSVYETFLSGQNWPAGAGHTNSVLAESNGMRKRPTSLTADRRTLFVWDEAGGAYGILRETKTSQFNFPISFGNRFSIQVNADCTHLYSIAPGTSGGYELVESTAM